ncbi:MAG: DUF3501 family protein [Rhodospirillales bacterium]|nr:DUF3501 family protein [Rhodospirillales bacterium]
MKRRIDYADILAPAEYARIRAERRREIGAVKRRRRVAVGPYVTFYFESYETMWLQVHEMLHIERGGPAQIPDELAAYNPLIPQGAELVATFMIEIDDPVRRAHVLATLGGIEETAFIRLGGETLRARPETDTDRTTAEGKASSVQFVHFPFEPRQIAAFRDPAVEAVVGLSHPNYSHMAVIPPAVRAELARDLD